MVKILCLGNEFLEIDSFAKKVGELLSSDFEVINVKDSFQLMGFLNEKKDFVIVDVVQHLDSVKEISLDDLRTDSILSAHDFDAGYVLKLIGSDVKIIGIPVAGDIDKIGEEVLRLIKAN